MKKKGLFLIIFLSLVAIFINLNINISNKNNIDSFTFENIEALAQGEEDEGIIKPGVVCMRFTYAACQTSNGWVFFNFLRIL